MTRSSRIPDRTDKSERTNKNVMRLTHRDDVTILPFEGMTPRIHPSVFLASGVRIVGDVEIGENSSVWFNVVIRGDVHSIRIGRRTNIQDLTMCHVTNRKYSLTVGDNVTVGHSAILHGATIHNDVLIGMGATVLDDAVVESGSIVGAGAVIREGFVVPSGKLAAGVPARIIRDLTEQEREYAAGGSTNYVGYVERFRESGYEW